MSDWLPDEHLVYFIIDIVEDLDIGPIEAVLQGKDGRGTRPYDPRMMVALLLYAYCTGVYSSRRIAKSTLEDVAFRLLTGDAQPHFTTVNEFRRVFREHFSHLFIEALRLCERAGMVKMGHVTLDGSKVEANASKHKAMSYKRMQEEEERLRREIEEMLERADAIDKAEDQLYGEGRDAFEWPKEMKTREDRRRRIKEAREALEIEAREERARKLREQADGMEETARGPDHDEPVRKSLRGHARNRRKKAAELFPEPSDEPDTPETDLPRRRMETTLDGLPKERSQRNFTDPDSHIMVGRDGYIQAYNGQAVVDDAHQVVIAADVTSQPPDDLDERQQMQWKLDTPEGRALYARRKAIVEPIFGQIKAARGFRRFSFRGLEAVAAEWQLVCAHHNLLKLYRARVDLAMA